MPPATSSSSSTSSSTRRTAMANEPATSATPTLDPKTLSNLMIKGDLSGLTEIQQAEYYVYMCDKLGLDPATQPFSLLQLQQKRVLYANKSCTDQLRKSNGVSVTSSRIEYQNDAVICFVTGQDKTGRIDTGIGAVTVGNLKGDAYCNAIMKAETKAKRRLTLALCGLSVMDETEVETVAGAVKLDMPDVTLGTRPVDPREETIRQWATSGKFTTDDLKILREAMDKGGEWSDKIFEKFQKRFEELSK
jgi:hypothetical protein